MLAPHAKALFARYSINLIVIASEAKQSIFQSRARAALQPARAQLGLQASGDARERALAGKLCARKSGLLRSAHNDKKLRTVTQSKRPGIAPGPSNFAAPMD
jgi:hypothetical protein